MHPDYSRLVHPLDIGIKAFSEDRIALTCGPTQVQLSRDAAYELQYQLAALLAQLEALEDPAEDVSQCLACDGAIEPLHSNVVLLQRPPS